MDGPILGHLAGRLHVHAMRMATVFTMSTVTITLRTKVVPRWIGMLGFAVAVVLLVSVGLTAWVELLFPAWFLAPSGGGADVGGYHI